jgi:glucose/arabinose dehydrogenase
MRHFGPALRALAFATLLCGVVAAQNMKAVRVGVGVASPTYVCSPPGDTHRLFVCEQFTAKVRIIKDGVLLPTAFLDIAGNTTGSEQGLLGLAFHPNYAINGFFYVNYTNGSGQPLIVRYHCPSGSPDVADPGSATTIYGPITHPQSNHNGGCLQFGPDGMLYLGMGDGGNFNDQGTGHAAGGNAQSPSTPLGKMLRFDVDIPAPYIPSSNPYFGAGDPLDEIWDFGMRNPFRFSFDRSLGDMYIGDVGQDTREEIDFEKAPSSGAFNYGWRCMEGFGCTGLTGCTCNAPSLTLPIEDYANAGSQCAVIGGYIYRGCAIPLLTGTYFYADYCAARIWSFTYDSVTNTKGPTIERTSQLAPGGGLSIGSISSFGEDAMGEILICDYSGGEIFKIINLDPFTDCNTNQIPDNCDIAFGNSPDNNANGIPDECECSPRATYCSGKFNSLGCLPTIASTGMPSASQGVGFVVTCSDVRNQKPGLLFYSVNGQASTPFQGGTLCVNPPVKRTPATNSGGSALPANDCTGIYSIDMNLFAVGGLGGTPLPALLVHGTVVDCQWWGRDPGFPAPNNTTLSNGLEYQVCP